jgi:hypothetical protein
VKPTISERRAGVGALARHAEDLLLPDQKQPGGSAADN